MAGRALLGAGILLLGVAAIASVLLIRPAETPSTTTPTDEIVSPLAAELLRPQLSARVPAGEVAIVIKVEPMLGLGGALRPGDHIDLYGFLPPQLGEDRATTQLLLQDAAVRELSSSSDGQSIVFMLPPERALLVQGAINFGVRPFLSIRSAEPNSDPPGLTSLTDSGLRDWMGVPTPTPTLAPTPTFTPTPTPTLLPTVIRAPEISDGS